MQKVHDDGTSFSAATEDALSLGIFVGSVETS